MPRSQGMTRRDANTMHTVGLLKHSNGKPTCCKRGGHTFSLGLNGSEGLRILVLTMRSEKWFLVVTSLIRPKFCRLNAGLKKQYFSD